MMYKTILSIIIAAIVLSNCADKEPALTFAVGGAPNEVEYWEKLIEYFTDSTGIKVTLMRQPTDTDQRRQGLVIPLKARKNDPDVFLMDVIWVGQFASSDWLLPLDTYIEADVIDLHSFFSNIISQVDMYNGKLVALPVYNDCGLLYYRKDLLEKYRFPVPTTWYELRKTAVKIQNEERGAAPHIYGFVWQGAQYEGLICTFLEFVASNRGGITDATGNIIVHNRENIEALQFMKELIHRDAISPPNTFTEMKEEEVRLSFENGHALFERNWPYAWGLHKRDESPINDKVGVAILPRFSDGTHAATLGGWHIGISKYADTPDKAWQLVKFIVSYDIQKKLALDLGWNPGRSDLYNDAQIKKHMTHVTVLQKAFENSVARPNLPYYTQVSEVLQRYVNAALSGSITPAEALERAQKEIEEVAQTYHE
ncbi:MAG: ABC transporter substrate-binding protein [candidate division WOR-3 bacterium]|nr:MAG: ABC transporter substrate-binding protein [candidate division WOR-3 bacterium]